MPSRVIRQVRCRDADDKSHWVDIAVVEAFSVRLPGGDEVLIFTKAQDAIPYIKDETGDENGKGNKRDCTRVSHMERVKGSTDPTQKFDIEVLDACAFAIPNVSDPSDANEDNSNLHGFVDSGQYGAGSIALVMPESQAARQTVDTTGLELAGGGGDVSRTGHINLVTEKGTTDDGTDGIGAVGDTIPPTQLAFCASFMIDSMSIKCPNGNTLALVLPKSAHDEVDVTVMTNDPDTNEPCPPDNTDPNHYIKFPKDKSSQGSNVGIAQNESTGKTGPIDMGVLWYIKKVSPGFRPWFWFADINTPLAFSFFGGGSRLGSWGYRGFVLFNFFPVIWIIAINFPLKPMGQFGSPSLDLCAREGNWDGAHPPVPSPSMTGFFGGPFGPFGHLQMTHVPLGQPPDGNAYGPTGNHHELWNGRPNVWQLTGLPQPARKDPTKPWHPFNNANKFPTAKEAEKCALLFKTNWNAVAKGHNEFIKSYESIGPGGTRAFYSTPPGWAWAIPWYDGFIGSDNPGYPREGYQASFQNGIPPGISTHQLPLGVYVPATSWTLDVDQLDASIWDTTKLENTKNPLNYFVPLVDNPHTWVSERH